MEVRKIFVIFCMLILTGVSLAQSPTRWRGPEGNGKYPDTDLLEKWPESGPTILWSFEDLGVGHSSVVASNNFLYATGMTNGMGYLFKFKTDGELVYKTEYGKEFQESYAGPRGSPVIAGDKIYLVSGVGELYCLNENDGTTRWKKNMVSEFDGEVIRWGYNETPVVDGDIVYCTPGGPTNCMVALNRHTGATVWTSPASKELTAYCTPLLFTHNGRKIITTHTANHLIGVDAATGKMLWSKEHKNKWSVHANTPIYSDGKLFYFSGYGKGCGLIELSPDGTRITPLWENETLDSRMGGAVLVNGYLYGSGDQQRQWTCIDWNTGKNMYESTDITKGPVIYADGKLYCYSERGELALVRATPQAFDILSETRVELGSEQHWAHPMIYKGVLYVRHGKAIIAYQIK